MDVWIYGMCELWMCGFVDLWVCELWMYCGYNLGEFIGVLCLYFSWLQLKMYFYMYGLIKIII